ncbi:hypothetical protein L7F22_065643 [Adiantum nelumboides]|nr:hypothetical protein [Adiantum nelumboides]
MVKKGKAAAQEGSSSRKEPPAVKRLKPKNAINGKQEACVDTKYKYVAKKVKPVALPLPIDCREKMEQASLQPSLQDQEKVGHRLSKRCCSTNGDFHYTSYPWNLRPIPIPKALLPKLIELLNEKIRMGILEPSCAPYSNRWFTVPKKNRTLGFIQDMQPVNKVTIRNVGTGAEAFARRAIYSMRDLYSGYDQFQLANKSRDLKTMRTPLGLVRMCTLPQGATNSVAHMMNGMNKVLRDFILQTTIPFLDDVPIKGCDTKEKDEALDLRGCRKFVANHIDDCDKILSKLEEVNLTLSGQKSIFGVNEVLIVGHMCGTYGRRHCPTRIDAIQRMKETCTSIIEVRRFLGACVFYLIWIPHYAHVADPLYQLLRKNQKFEWKIKWHVYSKHRRRGTLTTNAI